MPALAILTFLLVACGAEQSNGIGGPSDGGASSPSAVDPKEVSKFGLGVCLDRSDALDTYLQDLPIDCARPHSRQIIYVAPDKNDVGVCDRWTGPDAERIKATVAAMPPDPNIGWAPIFEDRYRDGRAQCWVVMAGSWTGSLLDATARYVQE